MSKNCTLITKNNQKMKKMFTLLVFVAVLVISQSVYGQTDYEKNQLSLIEREIDRVNSEIRQSEKTYAIQNSRLKSELSRQLRIAKMQADPRRAESEGQIAWANEEAIRLEAEIDSVESLLEPWEISYKREELDELLTARQEMIAAWASRSNSIPREMSHLTKNRRLRANVIRRDELTLNKIESNLNQAIVPGNNEIGYQVIFDNKYSRETTFILRGVDGGEHLAVSLAGRSTSRHYVIPGRYTVEYVVGGRKLEAVSVLNIDGSVHYYQTKPAPAQPEPCYGFVYKSAW